MADEQTIERHVIQYFAWRFNRKPSDFSSATPVRKAFKNSEAWAALADTFNNMSWMKQLGVMLHQSEMAAVGTIGELTELIAGKAGNKVALLSGAECGADEPLDWKSVG